MLFFRSPVDKVQRVTLCGYPFDCGSITLIYHPRNLSFFICNINGLSYIKSRSKKKGKSSFRETVVTLLFSE